MLNLIDNSEAQYINIYDKKETVVPHTYINSVYILQIAL